jgi:hypothetical protein
VRLEMRYLAKSVQSCSAKLAGCIARTSYVRPCVCRGWSAAPDTLTLMLYHYMSRVMPRTIGRPTGSWHSHDKGEKHNCADRFSDLSAAAANTRRLDHSKAFGAHAISRDRPCTSAPSRLPSGSAAGKTKSADSEQGSAVFGRSRPRIATRMTSLLDKWKAARF